MTNSRLFQSGPRGLNFCVTAKFLVLAVISVAYVFFVLSTESLPKPEKKYETEIRPLTDYGRDCGDLKGQATYRLRRSGSKAHIRIEAGSFWNASGLILERGAEYVAEVVKVNTWQDASEGKDKPISPESGWWPIKGPVRWFSDLSRYFGALRYPEKDLFVLMGAIYGKCEDGRVCAKHIPIGNKADITVPADGEFCAYANDVATMYGNNKGSLVLQVMRK